MRHRLPSILISLIMILSLAKPALSAPTPISFFPGAHLRFEHMTIDEGLSQNAGLALLQDRQGYLWIGSQDGLNRYDGYGFTHFKNDPNNPSSISYNSIISLFESYDGFLWIGTWGGGLNRFDPKTSTFTRYPADPSNPDSLSHGIVTSIAADGKDGLWIGTLGGLDYLDFSTDKISHFRYDPQDSSSLSSNAISVIQPAGDGTLWVGTGAFNSVGNGLNRFDPTTGKSVRFPTEGKCFGSPNISALLPDPEGYLWIAYGGYGVAGGGLDRYKPKTDSCLHFENAITFKNQITDNNITDLMFDQEGSLWATSYSGGVWYMRSDQFGQFIGVQHNASDAESLSSNNTFRILQDRSGVIWIGTLASGINKLNLNSLQFRTYRNDATNSSSLPSNHVGSFSETRDGSIWVGTWDSGLARFDPRSGDFESFKHDNNDEKSISSDIVMVQLADPDGTLWIGTLGGGLNHFDPVTKEFIHYQNDPEIPNSLPENQVTGLTFDCKGRLWVTTVLGISRFDPSSGGFVNYAMDFPAVTLKMIGNDLWVGTWGGGVSRLDLSKAKNLKSESASFTTLKHDPANANSLSENSVWAIHETADGAIWLGTQGGLNRFDPSTGDFKVYTEKNGLRNATILSILQDNNGILWLTTNNGLAKFDPQNEEFRIYDKSDGLQGNEFNSNAGYLSPTTGLMYIGGVSGFSVFNPLKLQDSSISPAVVITDFSIFNVPQYYDTTGLVPIQLNYTQNFISFEFAALDFQAPQKNHYAYMLEGFDKNWVDSGIRNYASYTNLPGGEYTFRVKAANGDGVWSEVDATLKINVAPPFWQTWPFQFGLALTLTIMLVGIFQWRTRSVRKQNVRLQVVVDEQKRVEAELRQSEARFRAIYENAAIGISLIAPDGHALAVNPVLVQLSGYTEEELLSLSGQKITFEEDLDVGRLEFAEVLCGKRESYQVEKRYVHKDGRIQWMRQTVSAVRETTGKVQYLVVIAEDIDERKRAVEELRESEARFKAIFDNAAVGVALMTLDRHIVQINPTVTRITGYTLEEMQHVDPTELVIEEDRSIDRELFTELVSGKRDQYLVEKRYTRKDGEQFWGSVNFALVRGKDQVPLYIIGIIEDITEEKLASERLIVQEADHRALLEQRIAERTEKLNQANELLRVKAAQDAVTAERTRLARDLHDAVTQTLFSTTLIADVLPEIWAMNPEEGKRRLEEVRQMTRGALAEMRTLLVELRPNALVEVPLPVLLRQLTEAMIGRSRMNIEMSAEGEEPLPADVQVGLYRIAQEALNNIVKHAKANQAVITLRQGETVRLTIADNGAGFDPSTVTADHLGLKIMKERAESIHAKLSIYSEPGDGTQISVVWQRQ